MIGILCTTATFLTFFVFMIFLIILRPPSLNVCTVAFTRVILTKRKTKTENNKQINKQILESQKVQTAFYFKIVPYVAYMCLLSRRFLLFLRRKNYGFQMNIFRQRKKKQNWSFGTEETAPCTHIEPITVHCYLNALLRTWFVTNSFDLWLSNRYLWLYCAIVTIRFLCLPMLPCAKYKICPTK